MNWQKLFLSLTLTEPLFSGSKHLVLANFSLNTEASAIVELDRDCSVLTNFTMNTEDRATFEWENGKAAMADLTKENGECIYR